MKYDFKIGVDPGEKNGWAIFDKENNKLKEMGTMNFWELIEAIDAINFNNSILIVIEDSSQNSPTFSKHYRKKSLLVRDKISQNVGENKRTAKLLIEYCQRNNIPYRAVKPTKNSLTKVSKEWFNKQTGWTGRSSEHARDAALLVWEN